MNNLFRFLIQPEVYFQGVRTHSSPVFFLRVGEDFLENDPSYTDMSVRCSERQLAGGGTTILINYSAAES